jgi:beta-lactamase class A
VGFSELLTEIAVRAIFCLLLMKQLIALVASFTFLLGVGIGYLLFKTPVSKQVSSNQKLEEIRSNGYKFISPLLECEVSGGSKLNALDALQSKNRELINSLVAAGEVTEAAVYFRELNNGPAFGVNQDIDFTPASLLKLPVMMAYLKYYDDEPDKLTTIKYKFENKQAVLDQSIKPTETLEVGREYTILELLEKMMIYSDNASLVVLEDNIAPALIDKVTLDLGIETAGEHTPDDYMSVRGYATLFRILYNASYLEKDMSEKALEILSKSDFKDGIEAGLPAGITVAHKFGERELPNGVMQLHDCGIVYYPNNPYLMCIMTRGTNLQKLASSIAKISAITYEGLKDYLRK